MKRKILVVFVLTAVVVLAAGLTAAGRPVRQRQQLAEAFIRQYYTAAYAEGEVFLANSPT